MKAQQLTSDEKRAIIVDAAEDKKANYVTEMDLRGKTLISDFFVICSGTSNVHIRSIADGVIEQMEAHGIRASKLEGYSEASWVLLDYGDVITHIMSEEHRSFYKLEGLWGAAGKEDPEMAAPATGDAENDDDDGGDDNDGAVMEEAEHSAVASALV